MLRDKSLLSAGGQVEYEGVGENIFWSWEGGDEIIFRCWGRGSKTILFVLLCMYILMAIKRLHQRNLCSEWALAKFFSFFVILTLTPPSDK